MAGQGATTRAHDELLIPQHRYLALDSLRGICACLVVLTHCVTEGLISNALLVRHAFLLVDFFFVLSGFVIGASYGQRLMSGFSVPRFMWLRWARIYPLHLAMLGVFLAFEIVFAVFAPGAGQRAPFTGDYSPQSFASSLLLMQIFFGPDSAPWNLPGWSIAAEIWTYLIFAILLRYASRQIMPICVFIALLAMLFLAVQSDRYLNVIHDGALARCMFGFALGLIGWRVAERVRALKLPQWADQLIEFVTVLFITSFVILAGSGPFSLAAPAVFLFAVLVFARERGLVSRLLRWSPFVLLGVLSYSIYMIHMFLYYRLLNALAFVGQRAGVDLVAVNDGGNMVGGGVWFGDAVSLAFLALVILCAFASYRLVERPALAFARARNPFPV